MACLSLGATHASAQPCDEGDIRCQDIPVTWRGQARLFDDVGFDTGFIPGGSPVQLRIALGLLSRTTVDMTGMMRADWPAPLTVHLTGHEGSGRLNMDFGLVFAVQLRLDISTVLGSIRQTFDIPTGLPSDLAFRGSTDFAPLMLPGQPGRPVSVTDTTQRFRVATFSVPVVAGLSVGGGLDIRGRMTTTYQTDNMLLDGVTVLAESQGTLVGPVNATAGFGGFQDIPSRPVGTFGYDVSIELIPVLTVSFFTFELARFDIGNFAIQAFESEGPAAFPTVLGHMPLPDVRFISTAYHFPETPIGESSTLVATIRNFGEVDLHVDMSTLPAPFTSSQAMLVISPGGFARTNLTFTPTDPGPVMALANVETNDPDAPTVTLDLRGRAPIPPMPDLGVAVDLGPGNDASVMADASMELPDGAVVLPDGAILLPDGAVIAPPDGTLRGGACGCRVPASHPGESQALPLTLTLGLLLGLMWRRRRR